MTSQSSVNGGCLHKPLDENHVQIEVLQLQSVNEFEEFENQLQNDYIGNNFVFRNINVYGWHDII